MRHRTLYIRNDWCVDVFIDEGYHPNEVMDCLEAMDAPNDILERAYGLIAENKPNQAFTYSNGKRTCIYIGWTTSGAEFINSMIHELRHLVDHIAEHYGINDKETTGYMSGDAAYLLAEDICEMGCPHCGG